MRLLEITKGGSGRSVIMQFTVAEMVNIIAMFETVLSRSPEGYSKEKKMRTTLRRVLTVLEEVTRKKSSYSQEKSSYARVLYEFKEDRREVDQVQWFVENGAGDNVQ